MHDARTDAELLRALRAGDSNAFEVLYRRHFEAALRFAARAFPSRADDLVSESFLAVYQQVTTTTSGPEFAFRSYLKTVIRNTAIRWRKDDERVVISDEVDQVDLEDGLWTVEQQANTADVVAAFEELPERWQRVLWLAEVADAGRPEIARELGIKPNAVSALQRRARIGLKFQWLSRQIPVALREDHAHVARLIPQHLTEPGNVALAAAVTAHVASCVDCREILQGMRGAARVPGGALAVLLGSAGIGVPAAAASLSGSTTATAAVLSAVSGISLTSWLLAGGLAVVASSVALTSIFTTAPAAPAAAAPAVVNSEDLPDGGRILTLPSAPPAIGTDPGIRIAPPAEEPAIGEPPTGRHIEDPTIPSAGLVNDPGQIPEGPPSPPPAGGNVPDPAGDPGTDPAAGPVPGMTSAPAATGYLPPVIAGQATPGSSVVVEVDGRRYSPAVAPDGTWAFDARTLQPEAGTYEYQVWAFDAASTSTATTGTFTVLPLVVQGFEQLTGLQDMNVEEAKTTGVVIAVTGPASGRVYIQTMQGHSAILSLDQNGYTRVRLLMDSRGWYYFTFRALDADEMWGPGLEKAVDVYDPDIIVDPWGPSDEEMTFQVVAP